MHEVDLWKLELPTMKRTSKSSAWDHISRTYITLGAERKREELFYEKT